MRKWIPVVLAALLGACQYPPGMFRENPQVEKIPPPPPTRLLRRPADFSFRDYEQKKEFRIRVYADDDFEEELVTVLDEAKPEEGERLATLDEYDYAMEVFIEDWVLKDRTERLAFHRRAARRERARNATLLNEMIRLRKVALREIEDRVLDLRADLTARDDTNTFQDAGEISFLKREIDRLEVVREQKEIQLGILEAHAWRRDQELVRSSKPD